MILVRIAGVWLLALSLATLALSGFEGFSTFVFFVFGAVLTLPALFLLFAASLVERRFLDAGRSLPAMSVGVAFGLLIPLFLYWIAPNKANALAGMDFIGPLCVGTGLLWSLTSQPVLKAVGSWKNQAR
jgi:hypothetical protein